MTPAKKRTPPVGGRCDARFISLRETFIANFVEREETGASLAIFLGGALVVDLWGGWTDAGRSREWLPDTLVNYFSVGKAFTTICALLLVESGHIDLDVPVERVWPEFGGKGKAGVTLRQILCHRAGLPAVRYPMGDSAMFDWSRMIHSLEEQEPWWVPGTAQGYHVNTFGYLIGEIVRRVTGLTIGTFFRSRVAGPLSADAYIGLARADLTRAADILWSLKAPIPSASVLSSLRDDQLMRFNAYWNPAGACGVGWVNTTEWRRAEIPSTNGHGTARGVARIYDALLGESLLATSLVRAAIAEATFSDDCVLGRHARFGLGFQLPQPDRSLGPNDEAFGHFGAGGSLGFADPVAGLAFGYVSNNVRSTSWQNNRNRALIDAAYACI